MRSQVLILSIPIVSLWNVLDQGMYKVNDCIKCEEYEVGDTFFYNGNEILVADIDIINHAIQTNQDLSRFCTSHIIDMSFLFSELSDFNQDISKWDVSNVTDMEGMFQSATSFNRDLNAWDVSSVTNMERMFANAWAFNGDHFVSRS